MCDPVMLRKREAEERGIALARLKKLLACMGNFVASVEERYAHITPEEREKVMIDLHVTPNLPRFTLILGCRQEEGDSEMAGRQ